MIPKMVPNIPTKTKSSITTPPASRGVVGCAFHFVGIFCIMLGIIFGITVGAKRLYWGVLGGRSPPRKGIILYHTVDNRNISTVYTIIAHILLIIHIIILAFITSNIAILVVSIAGCAFSVLVSNSSEPSNIIFDNGSSKI